VLTTEAFIIFLLLVANGIFAMSEIAVVAARKVRLQRRAEAGDRRAAAALRLKEDPTEFLSTVQVGITLVGIFAGAYSGVRLTSYFAAWLAQFPLVAPYREGVALAIVVGIITYFSLVIGELVPKAVALNDPERIAGLVAAPVAAVARLATPLVALLTASTNLVLKILRIQPKSDRGVTEEDIRALVKQATQSGDIAPVEQKIVEQVFRLGDRRVSSIMTPRPDLDWVDIQNGLDGIRAHLLSVRHPRILVCDGELDKVLGIAHAEDLLSAWLDGRAAGDLRSLLKPPLLKAPVFVPDTLSVFQLLETFRSSRVHIALVLDEFGAIEGQVTAADILEGLVGEIPSEPAAAEQGPIVRRGESSWLVDGATSIDDLQAAIDLPPVPENEQGTYQTLAGLVMTRLARVPREGDRFTWNHLQFEVVDMDGRRVDKVLIERPQLEAPQQQAG
jgi:putative hemolysin